MEEVVLTGQGERSDAAPATATATTAAAGSPAAAPAAAGSPAVAPAAAGSPAVAPATAAPDAVTVPPAADTVEVPARVRAPLWANLPYAFVLAVAAGGLYWVALGGLRHAQAGMLTVASGLLAAAVLRLGLPERAAGLLVSRRRMLDVLTLASLGAGIMVAVLVLPTP